MIFRSRTKSFSRAMAYETRRGEILEVAPENTWFVFLGDQHVDHIKENVSLFVGLFQKQTSSIIVRIHMVYDNDKQNLFIGDFESNIKNKGYGSIVLRNVIKLAEQLKCNTITGNLSSVDSDHFDKLKHLYEKYGFIVTIFSEKQTGSIVREIND